MRPSIYVPLRKIRRVGSRNLRRSLTCQTYSWSVPSVRNNPGSAINFSRMEPSRGFASSVRRFYENERTCNAQIAQALPRGDYSEFGEDVRVSKFACGAAPPESGDQHG